MKVDLGDVPAWIAIAVALVFSLAAWRTARKQSGLQETYTEAAIRSAEAAERSALAAERALEPSASSEEPPTPNVAWAVERQRKNLFSLRNTGSDIATGVTLNEEVTKGLIKSPPKNAVIRPGESATFMMIDTWQVPIPNEVWIEWDGSAGVAVPVPHGS